MTWIVEWSPEARKNLKKLDPQIAREVLNYLDEVASSDNPRQYGKALTRELRGYWRYCLRDYRVIVKHYDAKLVIFAVRAKHRSKVDD